MNITQNIHQTNRLHRQPGHYGSPAGTSAEHVHEPSYNMPVDRVTLSKAAKDGMSAGPAMEKLVQSEQDLSRDPQTAVEANASADNQNQPFPTGQRVNMLV